MKRTREDFETIVKICERAEEMGIARGERITLILDLENVHESVGLNLAGLLEADEMDFAHDITGIQNHINRDTKELENFFLPRYASKYFKSDVETLIDNATEKSQQLGAEKEDGRANVEKSMDL